MDFVSTERIANVLGEAKHNPVTLGAVLERISINNTFQSISREVVEFVSPFHSFTYCIAFRRLQESLAKSEQQTPFKFMPRPHSTLRTASNHEHFQVFYSVKA